PNCAASPGRGIPWPFAGEHSPNAMMLAAAIVASGALIARFGQAAHAVCAGFEVKWGRRGCQSAVFRWSRRCESATTMQGSMSGAGPLGGFALAAGSGGLACAFGDDGRAVREHFGYALHNFVRVVTHA